MESKTRILVVGEEIIPCECCIEKLKVPSVVFQVGYGNLDSFSLLHLVKLRDFLTELDRLLRSIDFDLDSPVLDMSKKVQEKLDNHWEENSLRPSDLLN